MILNIFNKDNSVAVSVVIATHSEVRTHLTRAYYELGLLKPNYEVLQGDRHAN